MTAYEDEEEPVRQNVNIQKYNKNNEQNSMTEPNEQRNSIGSKNVKISGL